MSGDLLRRLFHLTRAHVGSASTSSPVGDDLGGDDPGCDPPGDVPPAAEDPPPDVDQELARYYANLEIPYGSDLNTVRNAWKSMMKKYHPDLHGADPDKRRLAGELTSELTRAYQELAASLERGDTGG